MHVLADVHKRAGLEYLRGACKSNYKMVPTGSINRKLREINILLSTKIQIQLISGIYSFPLANLLTHCHPLRQIQKESFFLRVLKIFRLHYGMNRRNTCV